jgi:hypothetical protein
MRSVSSPILAHGRQHDDRWAVGPGELAADGQAVFARQHHVQHHQVDRVAGEGAVHLLAVRRGLDVIAVPLQEFRHDVADAGIVVDNQDFLGDFGAGGGHFRGRLHALKAQGPLWRTNVPIATLA